MKNFKLIVLAVLVLLWGTVSAMADVVHVSLDTSSLSGGTYALVLQLVDGDGAVDNSAVASGFNFGIGGGVVGVPDYLGTTGVSGDLGSSVSLDDSGLAQANFTQQFTAGSGLSFTLNLTNNLAAGALTPDTFAFSLCAADLSACYSDDPSGSGALAYVYLDGSGSIVPSDFATFGDSALGLPAPTITPEPSSLMLLGGGLLGLVAMMRRSRG